MKKLSAVVWCAVSTNAQHEDDKISLPAQESSALAFCRDNDLNVIATLRVPGFSRDYIDIHECANDMAAQGIDAFHRLIELWDRRGFDVMVCRDGDRFARTQTLFAYVVEKTISIGAKIYSLQDGWIDSHNYRMWIAMGGYKAAGDIDKLKRDRFLGMNKRAEMGLPTSAHVISSHTLIRDEKTGKALKMIVDESKRQLYLDIASLLLSDVSFNELERELYTRFGHVNPNTGRVYGRGFFYNLLHNPAFWGHSARHWERKNLDQWPYDETVEAPPGVTVWRNTHDPVFTGDLAQCLINELNYRHSMFGGKSEPKSVNRFAGVMICGKCGYNMLAHHNKNAQRIYWQCAVQAQPNAYKTTCPAPQHIREDEALYCIDHMLRKLVHSKDPHNFLRAPATQDTAIRLDDLQAEIDQLKIAIKNLMRLQAKPGLSESVQTLYEDEITEHSNRLEILETRLNAALNTSKVHSVAHQKQSKALNELLELGVDGLWLWSNLDINRFLRRLLGTSRFAVKDHKIVSFAERRK